MQEVYHPFDPFDRRGLLKPPDVKRESELAVLKGVGHADSARHLPGNRVTVVRKVWELTAQHTLSDERFREFAARREVGPLGRLSTIRLVVGARKARTQHAQGFLLLDKWLATSTGLNEADLKPVSAEDMATIDQLRTSP